MDYDKIGKKFLKKIDAKMEIKFESNRPYFDDDVISRDVYNINITRGGKSFKFKFGNSINNTGGKPSEYSVLACLQNYDVGTFNDFCSEFGYDTDSREALKLYLTVQKEYKNVLNIFGDVMDELIEI